MYLFRNTTDFKVVSTKISLVSLKKSKILSVFDFSYSSKSGKFVRI